VRWTWLMILLQTCKKHGFFSLKYMYAALVNKGVRVLLDIWQIKISTRIKIFLWYLKKGVTLTKDNLARRNWNGDTRCSLCHSPESIQHLFLLFLCQILVACCTFNVWDIASP
jgi:hypothetical protein